MMPPKLPAAGAEFLKSAESAAIYSLHEGFFVKMVDFLVYRDYNSIRFCYKGETLLLSI